MNKQTRLHIYTVGSFLFMLTMNALANIVPLGGRTTGQLSDLYPTLFTPAGFTFSIWGVIYALLCLYILFQLGVVKPKDSNEQQTSPKRVATLFAVSSVANGLWILAWHYEQIALSLAFMIVLLLSLIGINLHMSTYSLKRIEYLCIFLPFNVYLGWISIATIANVSVLLVDLGWSGILLSDVAWLVLVLLFGAFLGSLAVVRSHAIPYAAVFIWAYYGIWSEHTSANGFNGVYPVVIWTAILSMLAIGGSIIYVLYKGYQHA